MGLDGQFRMLGGVLSGTEAQSRVILLMVLIYPILFVVVYILTQLSSCRSPEIICCLMMCFRSVSHSVQSYNCLFIHHRCPAKLVIDQNVPLFALLNL